ncbi:hypothetical protein E1091_00285 [Micromonospora fluostatini]|uniref:Uncharacterized protein n=1 Tax=Micromonospora fluostatini TaxID=1629071 RepID=A0ABY2DMG9_9ACTN|nr:hypothetical protein E1091_00285 [Micromonospora fluostatini]
MSDKVILLAAGDTVYLFRPDQKDIADAQEAVLHVAYPAEEPTRATLTPERVSVVLDKLRQAEPDMQVQDLRGGGETSSPITGESHE